MKEKNGLTPDELYFTKRDIMNFGRESNFLDAEKCALSLHS